MKRPNNYENTQAQGEFVPIELGGHIMVIKEVVEMQSKTGKDMIKVCFDFAQNDSQAGYFAKQFADDIRPEKKWPASGTTYILTEDKEGNCSRQFKTFTTSVEKSNKGFSVLWGDKFAACFKNKLVGGVFGEIEEEYNGRVHMNHKLRWFRSCDGVKEVNIPEPRYMNGSSPQGSNVSYGPRDKDGFMNIPDGIDEELPFN